MKKLVFLLLHLVGASGLLKFPTLTSKNMCTVEPQSCIPLGKLIVHCSGMIALSLIINKPEMHLSLKRFTISLSHKATLFIKLESQHSLNNFTIFSPLCLSLCLKQWISYCQISTEMADKEVPRSIHFKIASFLSVDRVAIFG